MPTPEELREEAERARQAGDDHATDLEEAADAQEEADRRNEEAHEE